MAGAPILAYVEDSLPGETRRSRLEFARRHGLALEVANRGRLDPDACAGLPIVTVQAYRMHDAHPLHPDPGVREAAAAHLRDTIDQAARLGAGRVLAVCGYGRAPCPEPLERCRAFFAAVAPQARARGVRVLIEPLSRRRAGAMTGAGCIRDLLDALGEPDVFGAALDTGHIQDDGDDPGAVLAAWGRDLDEVQLRGPGSRPPAPDVPVTRWLAGLVSPPAVVAIEHRAPIGEAEAAALVAGLRDGLGR